MLKLQPSTWIKNPANNNKTASLVAPKKELKSANNQPLTKFNQWRGKRPTKSNDKENLANATEIDINLATTLFMLVTFDVEGFS